MILDEEKWMVNTLKLFYFNRHLLKTYWVLLVTAGAHEPALISGNIAYDIDMTQVGSSVQLKSRKRHWLFRLVNGVDLV